MAENTCASKKLAGLPRDCSTSMGGIKCVYLAAKDNVSSITITGDTVEAITMASAEKFYKYNFRKNTGSMESSLTVDVANGVNFVTTNVTMQFLKMDTDKRIEMEALSVNELVAIVTDSNGKNWLLGKDEPLTATAGTGSTGTAKTDGNKYTITLTDESATWPYEVPDIVLEKVIPSVSPGK